MSGQTPTLRPATQGDGPFLREMLREAASWARPAGEEPYAIEDLLGIPRIADYVVGWGRAGDGGTIADVDGHPVGACWYRLFTVEHPGYGFLGVEVPGLGFGVRPDQRRGGIGTCLLAETIAMARERGYRALGLSVEEENRVARRLYERAGFVAVGCEGDALTMRLDLLAGPT